MRLNRYFSLFLIILSSNAFAASIPKALVQIEKKYVQAVSLSMEFEQVVESKLTQTKKMTNGKIWFKRPGKIKWETLKPDYELLVSNGKTFWHFTPPFDPTDATEKAQVLVRDAKKVGSRMAESLLSGRFSSLKQIQYATQIDGSVILTPKKELGEGVKQARIWLDKQKQKIERIVLDFNSGSRTDLRFSKIILADKVPDSLFEYVIPAGADVIRQ